MDFGFGGEEEKQPPRRGGKEKPNKKNKKKNQNVPQSNNEEQKIGEDVFKNTEKIFFVKAGTFAGDNQTAAENDLKDFIDKEYENDSEMGVDIKTEEYYGNIEHKRRIAPTQERLDHLTTQMNFRLREGKGEAFYMIGYEDDGKALGIVKQEMLESLRSLCLMASALNADLAILSLKKTTVGRTAQVMVTNLKEGIKLDINIMLLGDSQAGKSTMLGVLTTGELDDGNGSARQQVVKSKHDFFSGRTSTVSHHILGFDSQGNITNYSPFGEQTWEQIVDQSTKIITFIDGGGHERYTSKIVTNLCSMCPDYSIVVISAVQGLTATTEAHFKLATLFDVPFSVVVTQKDRIKESELESLIMHVLFSNPPFKLNLFDTKLRSKISLITETETIPTQVKSNEDVVLMSRVILKEKVAPIFTISSRTAEHLDLFTNYLNLLPINNRLMLNQNLYTEFYISTTFDVKGKLILAGTVIKGVVKGGQTLFLGPDDKGIFRSIVVLDVVCKKVPVKVASCGQTCSINVKPEAEAKDWLESNKNAIRAGMMLIDSKSNPKASWEFSAEITPYEAKDKHIMLWENYEPNVISMTTKQCCKLVLDYESLQEISQTELLGFRQAKKGSDALRLVDLDHVLQDQQLGSIPGVSRTRSRSQDDQILALIAKINKSKDEKQSQNNTESAMKTNQNKTVESFEESKTKVTFDEKLKDKKNALKGADELNIRKRKSLKHLKLEVMKPRVLRFRFIYKPEFITPGQRIFISDSTMKATGVIKEMFN